MRPSSTRAELHANPVGGRPCTRDGYDDGQMRCARLVGTGFGVGGIALLAAGTIVFLTAHPDIRRDADGSTPSSAARRRWSLLIH